MFWEYYSTNKRARVLHHHPKTKLAEQTYNKSVQPKKHPTYNSIISNLTPFN